MWTSIPLKLAEGLRARPRDFCALECLANDPLYAKPDSGKMFLLWEAKRHADIVVEETPSARVKHPWVYSLFVGADFVRFPFNTWDADQGDSLSFASIRPNLLNDEWMTHLRCLPRWSTASRSCLALIPEHLATLPIIAADAVDGGARFELADASRPSVNVPEWEGYDSHCFREVISDPGEAASSRGVVVQGLPGQPDSRGRYRLYSVKTGVNYVGSKFEGGRAGKHRLEANCSMAMLRSEVIESMPNKDSSFGVQTEVLTITAPLSEDGKRDGFQVRDLSCLWPRLSYIPGQAIPYGRAAFDRADAPADQAEFWRGAFAVPLGRAKARLFLNYGLVHTSANAQNFLLGFYGHARFAGEVRQFVARDVGDTSWHDDYITKYFRVTPLARKVHAAFVKEKGARIRHVLRETSSGDYPPPHIMRLAAYSVLTHGFAEVLHARHNWTKAHQYRFVSGILDGFREYFQQALGLGALYPNGGGTQVTDPDIILLGSAGKYPADPTQMARYKQTVQALLKQSAGELLSKAAFVRQRATAVMGANGDVAFAAGGNEGLCTLLNAEEVLLCAGLELTLGLPPDELSKVAIRDKLEVLLEGKWPHVIES